VIPLGVSECFLRQENIGTERLIREEYFFSLTTHPRRKNIHSVLTVLARSTTLQNLKYVIAGLMPDAYLQELKREINDLRLNDKVILFGYATEAQLKNLYQHAAFFVYPSFYEGFGFPILESMACGTPVIASGTSSMSEIMPQAEWRINPHDLDDLQNKMEKMLDVSGSHREELIKQNLEFSKNFTWNKTALQYLNLYKELG
jgi:glycosyltransferase involved in cell wall biosynthesis